MIQRQGLSGSAGQGLQKLSIKKLKHYLFNIVFGNSWIEICSIWPVDDVSLNWISVKKYLA